MASGIQGVSESPFLQMPHTPEKKGFCSTICSCLHFCCVEPPSPKPRYEEVAAAADDPFRAGKLAIEKFVEKNRELLRPSWRCGNCNRVFLNQDNAERHFFCQDLTGSFFVWTDSPNSSPSILVVDID